MKINKILALLLTFILTAGFINPVASDAAGSSLSLKDQVYTVAATTTSTTIQWPNVVGASKYVITYADISKIDLSNKTGETKSITVSSDQTTYTLKKLGDANYVGTVSPVDVAGNEGEGGLFYVTPKRDSVYVTGYKSDTGYANYGTLSVGYSWTGVLAEGYEVQLVSAKGKVVASKSYTFSEANAVNGSDIFSGISRSSSYYFRVRGYNTFTGGDKKGQKYYGAWSKVTKKAIYAPQPTITQPAGGSGAGINKKSVSVKWKKVKGAVSYTVYAGKSSTSLKKIKTVKKCKYTVKNINTLNQTYYFAVRANVKIKGKKVSSQKNTQVSATSYYRY